MKQKKTYFIIAIILIIVQTTSFSQTNIFTAIENKDTTALKQSLQNGANPNITDADGYTPLLYTSAFGLLDCSKILVKYRADINKPDTEYGTTPLMIAAKYDRLETCIFLVENGADTKMTDNDGHTTLQYAELSKNQEIYDYLQDPSIYSLNDLQLIFPLQNNDTTKFKQILKNGANPNYENNQETTPLMYTAYYGLVDCAKILIKYEVNINYQTKNDKGTALMTAILGNQYEMCEFLIKNGADLNAKTIKDRDALYYAKELADSTGCTNILKLIKKPKKHKFNIKLETWENIDYKLQLFYNMNNISLLKRYLILAEQKADKEYNEKDTTYALKVYNINNYYYKLADTINVERTYLKTEKLTKKSFGIEHSNYFTIIAEITNFYATIKNKEKTIKYADFYTELMSEFYTESDTLYAKDMFELAKIYHSYEMYEKAENYYIEALTLIENFWGNRHKYYANICNSLAILYEDKGNDKKAAEYYEKSLIK